MDGARRSRLRLPANGTVTCETDDAGAAYLAGNGLTLTGTTFAANTSVLQARVTGTCPAGSSISAIAANGTVTCETDDAGAAYVAGSGLTLTGTTFAANTSVLQARVTGTCPAGSSISAIAANGTVTCETDNDTTYTAGAGITITGTTIGVTTTGVIGSAGTPTRQQGALAGIMFRIRDAAGAAAASGRLEFSNDGATWGTIVDLGGSTFDNVAANVICRSMGYSSGVELSAADTPNGTGWAALYGMFCPPWATNVFDCRSSGPSDPAVGVPAGTHASDIGVTCTP